MDGRRCPRRIQRSFKGDLAMKLTSLAAAAFVAAALWSGAAGAEGLLPVRAPAPAIDEAQKSGMETAVFAGGCFWGVQGVFQHVKGVKSAVSGYAGGHVPDPNYELVTNETTGHAEAVKVEFDPGVVTYGQLLQVFFSVITDPTTLNRQGNDMGPSYRSALFVMNDEQKRIAGAYVRQLDAAGIYPRKIVTEVTPYSNFYTAEDYHQDNAYTKKVNPGYLAWFDQPKIEDMKAMYPALWSERPMLVFASNY
jgi:peptide-methionine (S)-S-oxide reductase